ncbi:DNA double-strand break repair nuclease NurA [Metallosphaera cuprina]|uniref:NurA domain-containing protein n=1 Tax=Metallosphaera cuprina (strain Ar-4) TaxID=1006006 RepID=F4FYB5_METCR|nr:DNA double-strand break repair nuclease NurA [Metallosphaera cuprina]AEB94234.1 conserved hypothetical protein [Metallosphaera cuprina Ar-4]
MSVISESGVSNTIVRLTSESNYVFDLELAAIDGSLHDFYTEEGQKSYVVTSTVFFKLERGKMIYKGSEVKEFIFDGKGENHMRKAEYDEANSLQTLILMDRKLSMDLSFNMNLPRNVIAITKDFDERERRKLDIGNAPWIILDNEYPRTGYIRLTDKGWVFRIETTLSYKAEYILNLLYVMSREPIPEALGYNYPLFLADKLAKLYRDRAKRALDFIAQKELTRYRTFRSLVENRRRSWSLSQ